MLFSFWTNNYIFRLFFVIFCQQNLAQLLLSLSLRTSTTFSPMSVDVLANAKKVAKPELTNSQTHKSQEQRLTKTNFSGRASCLARGWLWDSSSCECLCPGRPYPQCPTQYVYDYQVDKNMDTPREEECILL